MSSANNSTAVQRWSGWRRLVQQGGTVLMVLALVAGYLLFFNFSGSVQAASFETAWEAGKLISVGSSSNHSLAIKFDGTVVAWGDNRYSQCNLPDGLTGVVDTAAGGFHTLALKSDGTVVAKGIFFLDQCTVPEGLNGVVDVAAGFSHSLALKDDGTVVAWGNNDSGKCDIPADLTNVVSFAAGGEHSLALKDDGTVVAWGSNDSGQCNIPADLTNVVSIAAGYSHSLALKDDGTIVAWGDSYFSQASVPAGLSNVVAVAAGGYHSLALKADGTVVAWGLNWDDQCIVPAGLNNVAAIAAGYCHSLALKDDGTVVAWGNNTDSQCTVPAGLNLAGQLSSIWTSLGVLDPCFSPETGVYTVTVPFWASSLEITALLLDPAADYLQIDGHSQPNGVPCLVSLLDEVPTPISVKVISLSTGLARNYMVTIIREDMATVDSALEAGQLISASSHSLAVKSDGTVVAWGENTYGQCNVPAGLNNVAAVAAGRRFSLALKDDGTVIAWGDLSEVGCSVPEGLSGVVALATRVYHCLALKNDGTVVAWGSNHAGQCTVPEGLNNVIAIAAGYSHSLALKSDGTVAAWGANSDGQCNVPEGLTDVVAIAAAQYYSVALKSDGTVVAWGNNLQKQCDVPAGLNNVVAIAATEYYSVALKSDGTAVSWSSTNVAQYVQNAVAVAGGYGHFLVLKNDGTIDSFKSSNVVPAGLNLAGGLSSIQTNGGVVSSCFDPDAGVYSVTVPNGAEELQIIAHLENPKAQVLLIDEHIHPDGAPFLVSPLTVGPNHVNLAVVSSATRLIRTYTVTITRADSDPNSAELWSLTTSTGSLDPVFDPAVTEYTASVDHRTSSMEICAIPFDAGATVTIGEGSPGDGAQTVNVALNPGENEILVLVRSANGLYEKQYTVTVHRASTPPAPPSPPEAEEGGVINLSGENRILTAIAISKWLYPDNVTLNAVVLARADNYPDALAGVPLAYALNAPLLLTYSDVLDPAVIHEVERILDDSGTVYILGGETAISPAIIGTLDDKYTVVRLHGNDRYLTAVKIAETLTPAPNTVFLASGQDFPDAVTISSIAARLGAPILLTEKDILPTAVADYLLANSGTIEKIYVIGGTGVISDTVYTQAGGTERIFGATRWATSAEIARRFFSSPSVITVSSGLGFPDDLTGGVLAAKYNAPVLLSHSFLPSVTEAFIRQESNSINRVFTFGGLTVVSPSITDKIKEILK